MRAACGADGGPVALVLLIFAVTSGTTAGWTSAEVLAPLVLALALVGAFLWWERRTPFERAVVPPRTWFYPNFAVLFVVALLPYFWWATVFNTFIPLWQTVYGWSAISTAIRTFPIGVVAFAVSWTGGLSRRIDPKWLIAFGMINMLVATVLFQYCDSPAAYWPYAFPAFILGSGGAMATYTHTKLFHPSTALPHPR
jgi:hypothetical protein